MVVRIAGSDIAAIDRIRGRDAPSGGENKEKDTESPLQPQQQDDEEGDENDDEDPQEIEE